MSFNIWTLLTFGLQRVKSVLRVCCTYLLTYLLTYLKFVTQIYNGITSKEAWSGNSDTCRPNRFLLSFGNDPIHWIG